MYFRSRLCGDKRFGKENGVRGNHALLMNIYRQTRKVLGRSKWLTETAVMLAAARFLVKFIPFRYWHKTLGDIDSVSRQEKRLATSVEAGSEAALVGRWVRNTASKVPFKAVCLPQAMAARWMLTRRNISTQLFIGARRDRDTKESQFHAWLMHGEVCVTGQHERKEFQAFGQLDDF
ncbi:Lasso peptide biosynthesis B2 protein [Parasphingorhabdus sp. NYA22]